MKDAKPRRRCLVFILIASALSPASAAQRTFLMGMTTIGPLATQAFENLNDRDLLSLHLDGFLGIPWTQFQNNTTLPASWVSQWDSIQSQAAASGKVLYLAVSPLSNRQILTDNVDANGTKTANWAPVDGSGCYPFATDANAAAYKQAYINYLKYLVDKIHPTYLTPGIEINIEWQLCPAQAAAFKQWNIDVIQEMKQTYPNLIVFPTFESEVMYGLDIVLPGNASGCGGTRTDATLAACFQQRLEEALTVPADRIAFSMYPHVWKFPQTAPDNYTAAVPYEDMFTRVQRSTHRKIWVSETGWPAVGLLTSYDHPAPPSACSGVDLIASPTVAGDANLAGHVSALLAQAQSKQFEAVVWSVNRDLLDATVAATCPCAPGGSITCLLLNAIYTGGGTGDELVYRVFGNMGMRNNDGTPRTAAYSAWTSYLNQTYSPVPGGNPNSLTQIQVYPNPLRPALGHTAIHFNQLPPNSRLRIYTLAGEKVRDLSADTVGHASWDGKNQSGQNAASGVYIVYVQSSGETKILKVAVQR